MGPSIYPAIVCKLVEALYTFVYLYTKLFGLIIFRLTVHLNYKDKSIST